MVGTIIKPKRGLQPQPFGEAYHASWQDGDFTRNGEPQGSSPSARRCMTIMINIIE